MDAMKLISPPISLLHYEIVNSRKDLSPQERQAFEQIKKGFMGEKKLAHLLANSTYENLLAIFGSLFDLGDSEVQIDCMLLTRDRIFLLEVKNYSGDYCLENGNLHLFPNKTQVHNPLSQFERSELLMKRLLKDMRIHYDLQSYVIFINSSFLLYGSSPQLPMIFYPQLKRFLQKLNANARPLTDKEVKLAEVLRNRQKERSIYERLANYELAQLKRGVLCPKCSTKLRRTGRRRFTCLACACDWDAEDVILHAVAQYHFLFPEEPISTLKMVDWCGGGFAPSFMRELLRKHLNVVRQRNRFYYYFRQPNEHIEILSRKYEGMTGFES